MRPLEDEWTLMGATLLAGGLLIAVIMRHRPAAAAAVDAPVTVAAAVSLWIGSTFRRRSGRDRSVAAQSVAMLMVLAAVAALTLAAGAG